MEARPMRRALEIGSKAAHTMPMPPDPMTRSRRYLPTVGGVGLLAVPGLGSAAVTAEGSTVMDAR